MSIPCYKFSLYSREYKENKWWWLLRCVMHPVEFPFWKSNNHALIMLKLVFTFVEYSCTCLVPPYLYAFIREIDNECLWDICQFSKTLMLLIAHLLYSLTPHQWDKVFLQLVFDVPEASCWKSFLQHSLISLSVSNSLYI